ncbi:MAG: helix-turn-helix domain-containing protein [Pseudomonadota bacterium]
MTHRQKTLPEPLLRLQDVAAILKCSLKTVKRRVDAGDMPVIRDGRMVRVHPEDLNRYTKNRKEE